MTTARETLISQWAANPDDAEALSEMADAIEEAVLNLKMEQVRALSPGAKEVSRAAVLFILEQYP
jgi:hypothetical protein